MNTNTGHDECITIFVEQVFPSMVNNYGTLFGGFALQWMDKAAWFVSTRYARQTMVTVASEEIIFKEPIPQGSMVELRGEIAKVGRTSITVQVEMYCEESLTGKRTLPPPAGLSWSPLMVKENRRRLPHRATVRHNHPAHLFKTQNES